MISRRSFIKGSVAIAATAAVGAARAAEGDKIRAAVIGCRNRGHQVASHFSNCGQFEIVTLCDCDTAMIDKAAKRLEGKLEEQPKAEQDFRRVLEDANVDAVINATPDHWHAVITTLALDAGKHVYLEKPASYNIAEGKALVAAQRRHPGLVIQVGTQNRSGQHFRDAKAFIEGGGLGKVGFARAWITHTRPTIPKMEASDPPSTLDYDLWVGPAPMRPYVENRVHYNWHFMRDYGTGEMANWGAHWLDVARWLLNLDVPLSACGYGGTYIVHDAKETPDTQTVLYEYPELTLLWEQRLWTKYTINGMSSGVEIGGENGTLFIDRGHWRVYPREGEEQRHDGSELDLTHARNFADCIRGDAKPNASIEVGHKTAILCHLGNITAQLSRRVVFDAQTETFGDDAAANALLERPYRAPWALPA